MFSFNCYIDESGDEGLSKKAGSSDWFILTGVIVHKKDECKSIELLKEVRTKFNYPPKKPIHWKKLKHEKKVYYSKKIADLQIRIVNICVMKNQILEPEKFSQESRLYFYSVRYLLERVSWFIKDTQHIDSGKCKLIFSNRATMKYDNLKDYLNILKRQKESKNIQINFNYFDLDSGFFTYTAGRQAGLQIADACAGAVFNALEYNLFGFRELSYLKHLSPVLYRHGKKSSGYGLKIVPREAILEIKKDSELFRILET